MSLKIPQFLTPNKLPATTGAASGAASKLPAKDSDLAGSGSSQITFTEHVWALRKLRLAEIKPTAKTILEAVLERRAATANEKVPAKTAPIKASPLAAETMQWKALKNLQMEVIAQDGFLADARIRTRELLERADSLEQKILELQETAERVSPPAPVVAPPAGKDKDASYYYQLFRESESDRVELERQVEELKVEVVLGDSLKDLVEEQKASLNTSEERIRALNQQIEAAGHLSNRVKQLESQLVEAHYSVDDLRLRLGAALHAKMEAEKAAEIATKESSNLRAELEQCQKFMAGIIAENAKRIQELEADCSHLKSLHLRDSALVAGFTEHLDKLNQWMEETRVPAIPGTDDQLPAADAKRHN